MSNQAISRSGIALRVPISHLLVICALMAAQVACGIFASVASSDTNRDIFFAQQIATGQSFPLTGPAINGIAHLGPLWYYLMALPLFFVPNAAAVTGMMGLLSATQFPLAYVLGRRVRNSDEGLLFALSLALPGWVVTSFGSLTHPIIAIPSLLLGTIAAIAYKNKPDVLPALGLGLALVLMGAAHPTLALPGLLLLAWCDLHARTWKIFASHIGMISAVVAIPFVPMLYEQWLIGFSDVEKASAYGRSELTVPSPVAAAELIYAVAIHGPQYVTRYWLELSATATRFLFVLHVVILVLAATGLGVVCVTDRALRRLVLGLIGVLVVQSMFVCAIRDLMPPWMIYVHGAMIAALIALGLGWFWTFAPGRVAVALLLAAATIWTGSIYAKLMIGSNEFTNIQPSPGKHGFMDVRDYEDASGSFRIARVAFRELFALGKPLCTPVALYGHYAHLIDYTYAVSAAQSCGTTDNVRIGGMPESGREGWLGLHRNAWQAIGMSPARWIGSIGASQPSDIWHSPVPFAPVVPAFSNFPRSLSRLEQPFTIEGRASAELAVLVSHRAHRYLPFAVVRVRADGREVAARYSDLTCAVFVSPARMPGRTVHWQIDIEANAAYVDVLTFASTAPPGD